MNSGKVKNTPRDFDDIRLDLMRYVFDQLFVNTQDVGLIFRDCPDYHT